MVGPGCAGLPWPNLRQPFRGRLQNPRLRRPVRHCPSLSDMVVVHTVDIDKDPKANVSVQNGDAILNMIVTSACEGPCIQANTQAPSY